MGVVAFDPLRRRNLGVKIFEISAVIVVPIVACWKRACAAASDFGASVRSSLVS
jgi:hypothetical protein